MGGGGGCHETNHPLAGYIPECIDCHLFSRDLNIPSVSRLTSEEELNPTVALSHPTQNISADTTTHSNASKYDTLPPILYQYY